MDQDAVTARGRATRQRLLHATTDLVREVGYAQTTIRAVARAAGIAEGTIYRHFPDKASLLLAAVAAQFEPIADWMSQLPARAQHPWPPSPSAPGPNQLRTSHEVRRRQGGGCDIARPRAAPREGTSPCSVGGSLPTTQTRWNRSMSSWKPVTSASSSVGRVCRTAAR